MKDPAPTQPKSKKVEVEMAPTWQKYANAVLIPIVIGLAIYLLVRYKINANAAQRLAEQSKLTSVRLSIHTLSDVDYSYMSQEAIDILRDSRYKDISPVIEDLLATAKEPNIRAEALVAKGDLNWAIAQFPDLPGATTRPTLAPDKPKDQLLSTAEAAYGEVVKSYPQQPIALNSARMGLAFVAENRGKFDDADKLFAEVENDPNAPEAFKTQAKYQREVSKTIRTPLYLAPATQPSTQPAVEAAAPAAAQSPAALSPATQPAVTAVAPTTKPTTQPAK